MQQVTAMVIYLFCLANGGHCAFVDAAHVTEYSPEMGGINCQEPCNLTGYLTPIEYGVTAACGRNMPYGTRVFIDDVGWRTCQDHGGAIDDDEVDVAVRPKDYLKAGISGYHDVVWLFPVEQATD